MKNSSNLNISCKIVFSLNKRNKKVGSPSSFGRKRPFISLNSSASIENLSTSQRARTRAPVRALITQKIDAQKGCAMQLNGITLIVMKDSRCHLKLPYPVGRLIPFVFGETNISFRVRSKLVALSESQHKLPRLSSFI